MQVAYFLSWPTLGSAIILVMMPSEDKMRQVSHLPLSCSILHNSPSCQGVSLSALGKSVTGTR